MNDKIKTGYIGIVRPGETEVDFKEFTLDKTDEKSGEKALIEIVDYITKKEDGTSGKISNSGFLPNPFNEFTMFMDYDQFDPDTEYNVGFFGTPIYGNMAFLQVDINSDNGDIIPITEDKKNILNDAMSHFKKFEKETGIYDAMVKADKKKFLEEYIKEKNTIFDESTNDIKGEDYDELQKAKKELEEMENKED